MILIRWASPLLASLKPHPTYILYYTMWPIPVPVIYHVCSTQLIYVCSILGGNPSLLPHMTITGALLLGGLSSPDTLWHNMLTIIEHLCQLITAVPLFRIAHLLSTPHWIIISLLTGLVNLQFNGAQNVLSLFVCVL